MASSRTTGNKPYPIRHYVKIMLFISFVVLILDFVISIASISIVKQQSAQHLQDTADMYIDRINQDFTYLTHYMGWTLANDESLSTMNTYSENSSEFLKSNENLRKRFTELQKNYGKDYNFFYYLKDKSFFMNCAPLSIPYNDYQELKKQVMSYAEDQDVYEKFYSRWQPVLINDTYYVMNIVPYYDSYMISMISADHLISPLRQINLGEHGYVSLISEDLQTVTSPVSNSGKVLNLQTERSSLLNLLQIRTTVNGEFTNAAFIVKLVIQIGTFEKIMIAQLLIVLLAVIIACNLCFIMLYFKKKVLIPITRFSYNLAHWTDDHELLDIESSNLVELEKANKQFIHLVSQIKNYKIDIYERELEKQRIQLNYMKLQIKPHFFLNCLTNIHSMAQMQMYNEIQQMALSTSKYFRYIFQNDQDFVRLEDEIEHVRVYLEIQKHRYRDAFIYRIEQAEHIRNVNIPPLVLQTFIENAIKYAISREHETQISLTVDRLPTEGEELTVIRISDSGPGFPLDILEKLQHGEPLEQSNGTHIGIMNTIQRLAYLYQNKAKVSFSNMERSGACVTLYLPDLPKDYTEMENSI